MKKQFSYLTNYSVWGMQMMEEDKIVTVMTEICQIKSTAGCILISLLLHNGRICRQLFNSDFCFDFFSILLNPFFSGYLFFLNIPSE